MTLCIVSLILKNAWLVKRYDLQNQKVWVLSALSASAAHSLCVELDVLEPSVCSPGGVFVSVH